jgi:hypothetical protein
MKRRDCITLLGGGAVAWPLAARAQQSSRAPTIGFLGISTPPAWIYWTVAFVRRLGELGWTDGRTVAIEYRWAEGWSERYTEIAAEFARLNVDVNSISSRPSCGAVACIAHDSKPAAAGSFVVRRFICCWGASMTTRTCRNASSAGVSSTG